MYIYIYIYIHVTGDVLNTVNYPIDCSVIY